MTKMEREFKSLKELFDKYMPTFPVETRKEFLAFWNAMESQHNGQQLVDLKSEMIKLNKEIKEIRKELDAIRKIKTLKK